MQTANATDTVASPDGDARRLRSGLISTLALALLLGGIALAVPDLRGIIGRVAHAHLGWLALAVALELGSCLGYVAVVRVVLRRYPAREVRWLAWAEMAFGAVVPVGGAGGLAVGAWAMRAWGIAWSRIANRSAVIFLLTSAVNASVLAVAALGVSFGFGSEHIPIIYGLIPAAITIGGLAFFLWLPRARWAREAGSSRGRTVQALGRLAMWVHDTEAVLVKGGPRLLGAAGYLLFDIATLWACLHAVGQAPPLFALVVGYQIGYLANLIPIPGGLGVLEGGLLGALVLYGLPPASTAAAVVLYHAIALWVPAIGGTLGFARLRRVFAAPRARLQAVPAGTATAIPAAAQAVDLAA